MLDYLYDNFYIYAKALHFAAFISWMAALFYLPRLFVYHREQEHRGAAFTEVIKMQELKLYKYIANPACILTFATGLFMLATNFGLLKFAHMHLKLLLVFALLLYHLSCGRFLKQLARDGCKRSGKFFRFYNEVPTLLMFGIIYAMIIHAS